VKFKILVAHLILAALLSASALAIELAFGFSGLAEPRLLPVLALAAVGVPPAVFVASRVAQLSFRGVVASALLAALGLYSYLMWVVWAVAVPADPDASILTFALHNGPVPLLRLWALLAICSVLAVWGIGVINRRRPASVIQ
jgi:hypothetical protein